MKILSKPSILMLFAQRINTIAIIFARISEELDLQLGWIQTDDLHAEFIADKNIVLVHRGDVFNDNYFCRWRQLELPVYAQRDDYRLLVYLSLLTSSRSASLGGNGCSTTIRLAGGDN